MVVRHINPSTVAGLKALTNFSMYPHKPLNTEEIYDNMLHYDTKWSTASNTEAVMTVALTSTRGHYILMGRIEDCYDLPGGSQGNVATLTRGSRREYTCQPPFGVGRSRMPMMSTHRHCSNIF